MMSKTSGLGRKLRQEAVHEMQSERLQGQPHGEGPSRKSFQKVLQEEAMQLGEVVWERNARQGIQRGKGLAHVKSSKEATVKTVGGGRVSSDLHIPEFLPCSATVAGKRR